MFIEQLITEQWFNKTIALVGNAPLIRDHSKEINRFDVVIRFNLFKSSSSSGSKATHWCVNLRDCGPDSPRNNCRYVKENYPGLTVITPFSRAQGGLLFSAYDFFSTQGYEFIFPENQVAYPLQLMPGQGPSAGFAIAYRIVSFGISISLYGFNGKVLECHDGTQELGFLRSCSFIDFHEVADNTCSESELSLVFPPIFQRREHGQHMLSY